MGNSIRTTSKTTTPAAKKITFAIGDVMLCPLLGDQPFVLEADPYGKSDKLTITYDGSYSYYDTKEFFIKESDDEAIDYQPSLFQNTLYSNAYTTQSSQHKIISITELDEKEAVLISSMKLSNIACDINGAVIIFEDSRYLLSIIYQEKVTSSTAQFLARLAHDSSTTWSELLFAQLDALKKPLSQSNFDKTSNIDDLTQALEG